MQEVFRHEALPYAGLDGFVASCAELIELGDGSNTRLMFLLAAAKLEALRDAVGDDSDDIAFVATDQHGRNPARITTMLDSFQATANGRQCVGVNEVVSADRSPQALAEAWLAESALNSPSLQTWPLSVVCLYDTSTLESAALDGMRRCHRVVRGEDENAGYDPEYATTLFQQPLADPPAAAEVRTVGAGHLAAARAFVRENAADRGLAPDRLDDLVLATNELVTNSLRHGGGECRLTVWEDETSVVCEVRDPGVITDPLAGRLAPAPSAASGRGLWLANHLCDLVQVRSSQTGTVARLHVEW
jgi:anti-sigma regulatory factor (Ser/Thr protein kinase)